MTARDLFTFTIICIVNTMKWKLMSRCEIYLKHCLNFFFLWTIINAKYSSETMWLVFFLDLEDL